MSTWPKVAWPSVKPTTVSSVSKRSTVSTVPISMPSLRAVSESTTSCGTPRPWPSDSSGSSGLPGSMPNSDRSAWVPSVVVTLIMPAPTGSAISTSGRSCQAAIWSASTTERDKALSVLVPSSKAKAVAGSFFRPETPSLTSPADRPDSITIRMAMRAMTAPIRPKRPRAKRSSRSARNMGVLGGIVERVGCAGPWSDGRAVSRGPRDVVRGPWPVAGGPWSDGGRRHDIDGASA